MKWPATGVAVGLVCLAAVAHDAVAKDDERTNGPERVAGPQRSDPEPGVSGRLAVDSPWAPEGRDRFWPLIVREAQSQQLPASIADAVVRIESSYNPSIVGGVGEIGLMQVRPSTAAMLGFRGSPTELSDPETNIRYGVAYLAQAWRLANGDLCRALMKYRAGHGEERMSSLSAAYCDRAKAHLAALGAWPGEWKAISAPEGRPVGATESPKPRSSQLAQGLKPKPVVQAVASFWAEHRQEARTTFAQLSMKARARQVWTEHGRHVASSKERPML